MCTCSMSGLAVVGLLSAAFAMSGAVQQGPPKPAPEMAQMTYMDGTWSCTGKAHDVGMGPGGPLTSTAVIRKDLGGFFQSGTIKATMPNQPPFEGRFNNTYDSGMKQFVMLWVDSMGGWSQTTSSGWKGDVIVYEGDSHMGGQTMKSRDTFTKAGPTSMKHTWEMEVKGKWMMAGEETCTKK